MLLLAIVIVHFFPLLTHIYVKSVLVINIWLFSKSGGVTFVALYG